MIEHMNAGQLLELVYGHAWTRAAVILILADVLSGVAVALYHRDFQLARIGEFLLTRAIPYLIGAGVLELVVLAVAPAEGVAGVGRETLAAGAWIFAIASLVGHVLGNLRQMGVPIPASLAEDPRLKRTSIAP